MLILIGVLLGRFVCGFLCPFGWLQDLLHKIPGKKLSTKKVRPLTYIKYAVLAVAVVLLPACGQFEKLARRIVPADTVQGENVEQGLSQLDEKFFRSPALALASAHQAIDTMARLACTGVNAAMELLIQKCRRITAVFTQK